MQARFIHLHAHSHYSLLNALPKIGELVKAAKEQGMPALALTDNGNLYGAIEFYKACKKEGLKPILGVDAYLSPRKLTDKEARIDNRTTRIILLVKNITGYKNLIKLVTVGFTEGFYYRPRIDKTVLEKYHDGLACVAPAISSDITQALKIGDPQEAENLISYYSKIFGRDNFFLEITNHPEFEGHQELMKKTIKLAEKTNASITASHEVYYIKPEDREARRTLLSVQSGADLSERGFGDGDENFSFISLTEAADYFKNIPTALENNHKIAEMCDLELELGKWVFPDFPITDNLTPDEELKKIACDGLVTKKIKKTPETAERLEYELSIISKKGYAPYFLVVTDLMRYAHQNGILTTIRGSVAGSLVTYLLDITNVNPLEYNLPFERFLNPERPSAPDIDMDFADDRRDEMIEYAKKRYGSDKVAQIGPFGTMMARGSIRDVARAMGYPYSLGDRVAKLVPFGSQGFPMTIDRAMEIIPELREAYDNESDIKTIIDMARKIEGCARHISVHAAGVVISPKPLIEYTPLQLDPKGTGKIITQYDMYAIEEAGLLKFDFLGIKNLSILSKATKLVEKLEGAKIEIDKIPIDDKKTFEMLARGETEGTFQLNGDGMTHYLKELKPTTIHDINAMVALYRPGPMESIPKYIERKHNPKLVSYLDPRLKEILSQSYGVITYQDDVLLIAIKLADYSWLEADKLRKAMGKKIPEEMEAQREKLINGFIKNGSTKENALSLWKLIEPFAAYGFNKANAASYGKVAYQTAYMKAHYPAIYMSAVLTADAGDVEKIAVFIKECQRMNILVPPPDINESCANFTVVRDGSSGDKIRFGLMSIKNFGEGVSNTIIEERVRGGLDKSLSDFLRRIKDKNLNKKSLESLIMSGALDNFGERGRMLANMELLLEFHKESSKESKNQDSLFGNMKNSSAFSEISLKPAPPATQKEKLTWEKELLGLYISGHPMDQYKAALSAKKTDIHRIKAELKEGMITVINGIIESVRPIITKNGEQMAFIKVSDLSDSIEVVVFPRIYSAFKDLIVPDSAISIKGRLSHRNNSQSVIADKIKALSNE